jgi:hypothetical protein
LNLRTASLHPYRLNIDGEELIAERLTIGDMAAIAESVAEMERQALEPKPGDDEEARQAAWQARSRVETMTPGQTTLWLISSPAGPSTALWRALSKRHPEWTLSRVLGLAFDDELLAAVYDLVGVRRVKPKSEQSEKSEGEHSSDPPRSVASGELP